MVKVSSHNDGKKGFFVAEVYSKQLHWILTFLFSELRKKWVSCRRLPIFCNEYFLRQIHEKKMLKSIMLSFVSVGDMSARAFFMQQLPTEGSTMVKHFLASQHLPKAFATQSYARIFNYNHKLLLLKASNSNPQFFKFQL